MAGSSVLEHFRLRVFIRLRFFPSRRLPRFGFVSAVLSLPFSSHRGSSCSGADEQGREETLAAGIVIYERWDDSGLWTCGLGLVGGSTVYRAGMGYRCE